MNIDLTQTLKDTENSLRDFIANTLNESLGNEWEQKCGVSSERIKKWKQRKSDEGRRQKAGVVEERLIYYADFYDLQTILRKHWDRFSLALGELKVIEVYLSELEKLRDPDAHRRELLPHQKHLAAGIAGEIRTRLIRYRSKQETSEDYFPRFESVRDSLGNIWIPNPAEKHARKDTGMVLRPGDTVDFVITASDPLGEELVYGVTKTFAAIPKGGWQIDNTVSVQIERKDIASRKVVWIRVKSSRPHHATYDCDDEVAFIYTVLPEKVS